MHKLTKLFSWMRLLHIDEKTDLSLSKHLSAGSSFKAFGIRSLLILSRLSIFNRLPVISGLVGTAKSLLYGHMTESKMIMTDDEFTHSIFTGVLPTEVDVLVVGSGPGAASAVKFENNHDMNASILVLERGDLPRTPHSAHHTLSHVIKDFFQAGQELILAKGFPLFAQANVVGGGSEVNSGLYHDLPEKLRDDYANLIGIPVSAYLEEEKLVRDWLKPEEMDVQESDSIIGRGGPLNSLKVKNVPRWRTYSDSETFVHRGMNETYWNRAVLDSKISLVSNVEVLKLKVDNPDYVLVKARTLYNGEVHYIKAKKIHVSAGTIATPLLLMKSGLIKSRNTRFGWHPMTRVVARCLPTDLGAGDIDPFQAWNYDRSLKFGSAVSTPSLLAVALGRTISHDESKVLRSFYVSFSSSGRGGIISTLKCPWYFYSKQDRILAKKGLTDLISLIEKGGGEVLEANRLNPFKHSTVHVFGSLPLGNKIYVKGTNKLRIDPRISISDASILPIGPGVNPQGVVMSTVSSVLRGEN